MYTHTHTHKTCAVCNKALRISLQLNDLLHTPEVHGHPLEPKHWCTIIHKALNLQTFASNSFAVMHNHLCMLFPSRTTFSLLQTNGLLSGSGEQVCQYTYTSAAVDFALWNFTLQTVSMEWVMSAKCRVCLLLFGWHPMGETSISS
jgi:hypothetical protein